MEAAPGLDAFEDQEVRQRGRELDVGGALDRPAIEMRRDLRIVRLRHRRDLLGFQDAADAAERHLQDRGGAAFQHAGELVFGRTAARRSRSGSRCRAPPAPSPPAFPAASAPRTTADRRARCRLARRMAPEAVNWPCVPNSRSALLPTASRIRRQNFSAAVQRFQRRLARIEGGVGRDRIELQRGEALLHIVRRALRRQLGIVIDALVLARPAG